MNIFFFGNTSFTAQYLSKALIKKNNMFFFSRKINREKNSFNFDLKKINHKIFDKFFLKKIDYLFFFSSYVPKSEKVSNWDKCMNTNVKGLINILIKLKIPVKKIILASSCSVYGENRKNEFKENIFLKPENPYSMSKFLQEKVLQVYCSENNIDLLSYRIGYVFGDNMKKNRLVKKIFLNHKKNKKIILFNKNLNLNLIHTRDISNIIINSFKKATGIFNLTYPYKTTLGDFHNILTEKKIFFNKKKNNFNSKKLYEKFPNLRNINFQTRIEDFKNEN